MHQRKLDKAKTRRNFHNCYRIRYKIVNTKNIASLAQMDKPNSRCKKGSEKEFEVTLPACFVAEQNNQTTGKKDSDEAQ